MVKNPCRRLGFDPGVGKMPWRGKWQATPVFLPGESQGQRSLAGYSPWGRKESDMTERLGTHTDPMAVAFSRNTFAHLLRLVSAF